MDGFHMTCIKKIHIRDNDQLLVVLICKKIIKKLVPCGTDDRLLLSGSRDLDLELVSDHRVYRHASVIDLYLHTKCH